MHKFTVSITREIEADTAEEAALLLYQELSRGPIPDRYSVVDETKAATEVKLDREKARRIRHHRSHRRPRQLVSLS